MKRRTLASLLLAAQLLGGVASAKVLVTCDNNAGYTASIPAKNVMESQIKAWRDMLDRFNVDYTIVPATQLTTWMCRFGVFWQRTWGQGGTGAFGYDSTRVLGGPYDGVIHLCFNGAGASNYSGYRPDSMTLTRTNKSSTLPVVPQLFVTDEDINAAGSFMSDAAGDSTGVVAVATLSPGPFQQGADAFTQYSTTSTRQWFATVTGDQMQGEDATGGIRVLLAETPNDILNTIQTTGVMTMAPDSCSSRVTDAPSCPDMVVWERLNSHCYFGAGNTVPAAHIIFCRQGAITCQDSSGGVQGPSQSAGDKPALLIALARLDSLTGGKVFNSRAPAAKVPGIGFIITHVGDRSARQNPGGIFAADTTIGWQACDSLRSIGAKVLLAADPESLAIHRGDIAGINRIGQVRWTPFVRDGIDTLAIAASGNDLPFTVQRDVFGRYRNRAFYGDSTSHTTDTGDSSITANLIGARRVLQSVVGTGQMSTTLVPPDFNFSPYQVRSGSHGNAEMSDSLAFAAGMAGYTAIVGLGVGRDAEPSYLSPPVGWQNREGVRTLATTGLAGYRFKMLMAPSFPVSGSTKFIRPNNDALAGVDTIPPYTTVLITGPATALVSRFWSGFFTTGTSREYNITPYDKLATTAGSGNQIGKGAGIYHDVRDFLYGAPRGSIVAIPAQWLGGAVCDPAFAMTTTAGVWPTRNGWYVFKDIKNVIDEVNARAGRVVLLQSWPEEIGP